jgi:hypothetical protein
LKIVANELEKELLAEARTKVGSEFADKIKTCIALTKAGVIGEVLAVIADDEGDFSPRVVANQIVLMDKIEKLAPPEVANGNTD